MPKLLISLFLVCCACTSWAAQVITVTKSQRMVAISDGGDWSTNDNFCIMHDDREVACGKVVKTKGKAAFGRIDSRTETISKGDPVLKKELTEEEARENQFFIRAEANPHEWFNVADITVSSNWLAVALNIQQAILPNFSMSIQANYLPSQPVGNGTLSGYMVALTTNFYSNYLYDGLWVQLGVGGAIYWGVVGGVEERAGSFVGIATLGWRWRYASGFNFGVAGGIQYYTNSNLAIDLQFSGFMPSAIVDVGFVL